MIDTPRMTRHAVERCAEMGISTKVAKAIVRRADITRPSRNSQGSDARIAVSDHPDLRAYAVVYYPVSPPLVLTVVFRTVEHYTRAGAVFDPITEENLCDSRPAPTV